MALAGFHRRSGLDFVFKTLSVLKNDLHPAPKVIGYLKVNYIVL